MVESYLIICALMLVTAVLVRALPVSRVSFGEDHEDGWDLSARQVAYLRAGRYGVVLAVLAELHGEGAADLSRGVARRHPPRDLHDRLTVAVYSGLRWTRRPRLLALLPRVGRACAPLRWDLLERHLLVPARRRLLAVALRVYALGLATAMVIEDDYRGSTMLAAAGVGVLTIVARGPRRTVAGFRELRWHRAALAREAAHGLGEAAYLSDLVAAHGAGALRVLCADYVRSGALAPLAPSYEPPVRAPEPVPAPLAPVVTLPRPRSVPRFEVTLPRQRPAIFVPAEPPEQVDSAVLRQRVSLAA